MIKVINATENNLKGVSVEIPKKKITVFTGVSGSGKSSLCIDTIAAASRRELNSTFPSFVQQYLPKYGRPEVETVENLPVAIMIDQKKPGAGNRSTVGTYTDIYALLRLLFSRVGKPFVGYSESFSFNHPEGKCERCDGIGEVTEIDIHKLVDFDKCLNDEGVINFPTFTTGAWRWKRYAFSGLFDNDKKIRDYSDEELQMFLYSPQIKLKDPPSNWPKAAQFEGIIPRMYRSIIQTKEGVRQKKTLAKMTSTFTCPKCNGARVNERVRSCYINGKNIAEVVDMPIDEALSFVKGITEPLAADLVRELTRRLSALCDIGLSYLSLSRGTSTLSGGESQRIKIAKYINSALTDMVYVLDEPSAGLHPHDIDLMKRSLKHLRDTGNTVMIVEHHKELIEMADYCIDMGPLAGENGGEVMYRGDYAGLLSCDTLTGKMLSKKTSFKDDLRSVKSHIDLHVDSFHNLKKVDVRLPLGVMTVICGVAGSGKSSLMESFSNTIDEEITFIGQNDIGINLRSTPATYMDFSDNIRSMFAKANKKKVNAFSFNSEGGCPVCKGRGVIVSEMAFMDSVETICEACGGKRYSEETLTYKYRDKNIGEVMDMTVDAAIEFFKDAPFTDKLAALKDVGLSYLHLNQALTTLSGGELQRLKLASFLGVKKRGIFVIDEPSSGLHPADTQKLILLFERMVDEGNTLFVIDHSPAVIHRSDYLIEMGPGGGMQGGRVLYQGMPKGIMECSESITREYL